MKRNQWIAGVTVLLLLAGLTVVVMANDCENQATDRNCASDNGCEPAETVVTLDQVPAAVAATIRREAAGATINEIVRKDGRGRSLYEAELITDGRERDLLVKPDGSVVDETALREVGEGDRDEVATTIDQVPAPVAAAIRREAADAAITEIVKGNEDGRPVYEVTIAMGGAERELVLAADGSVLEATVTIDQVPAPVAAAIRREAAGAAVKEIVRVNEDGRTVYEATLTASGAERELVLAADGKVLEAAVTIDQVPAPVAATIRRVGDGMTLREIVRIDENGQTVYEATLLSRGREGELRVAPDGSILPEEAEENEDEGEDAAEINAR